MIVVATKLDATTNREHLEELRAFAAKRGLEFHAISSASGEGIVELVRAMADALDRIPKPAAPADAPKRSGAGRIGSDQSRGNPRGSPRSRGGAPGGALTSHAAHKPAGHDQRRSVALFGGTFDPIHAGHIAVAQAAQRRFHLDAIYFIPSSRPPHKAAARTDAFRSSLCDGGAGLRRASGVCAVAGRSAGGRRRAHVFYTIDTVRRFHREHPGRSSVLHRRRGPVPRNSHLEKLRVAARCLRFHHREPARLSPGCAAAGDPAGKTGRAGSRTTRNRDRAAQIDHSSADHRREPRLVHRGARAPANGSRASTGLCPRAWRNTFSGRPCTGDTWTSLRPEIRWAVEAAQDKQAVDVTVLKLSGTGAFAEYFLLCSGHSQPQITGHR